jgi:hypothetical protein
MSEEAEEGPTLGLGAMRANNKEASFVAFHPSPPFLNSLTMLKK